MFVLHAGALSVVGDISLLFMHLRRQLHSADMVAVVPVLQLAAYAIEGNTRCHAPELVMELAAAGREVCCQCCY